MVQINQTEKTLVFCATLDHALTVRDQEKLTPLLRLKYHNSIADAIVDLGRPEDIGTVFSGFQKYLYQQPEVA